MNRSLLRKIAFISVSSGFVVTVYWRSRTEPEPISAPPLRLLSRAVGHLCEKELPHWCRPYFFSLFAGAFGCRLDEIDMCDLKDFPNLSSFFRRKLKENSRPICEESELIAPCDGRVLRLGPLKESQCIEKVKGATFTTSTFLGQPFDLGNSATLYQCVIYLSPGDYHCFHSPTNWTITERRHIAGTLLGVSPRALKWFRSPLNINERVVYCGTWSYGFFSYTAVGATNVGSIVIDFDQELTTNAKNVITGTITKKSWNAVAFRKGEMFGEFNLGSTIVLIFQGPKDLKFAFQEGDRILTGQSLLL